MLRVDEQRRIVLVVVEAHQQILDEVDACQMLIVGTHNGPGRDRVMSAGERLVARGYKPPSSR